MTTLRVRPDVQRYRRDTYLGVRHLLNQSFDPIDCAVGQSQWGVSDRAREAHATFRVEQMAAYPELFYDTLLKPTLMDRFQIPGLAPSHIFFGHGSFNLAERLLHKLIDTDRMLGIGPQFNEIPSEYVAGGGKYLPVPILENYELPLKKLADELETGTYSVLYLDNPNNPLGRLMTLSDLETLIAIAERHGTIMIVDEAYGDFVADEYSAASLVPRFNNLAVIRSFSKGLGLAAARVGYMFLSESLGRMYKELDVPFEPGLHGAILASATLEDTDFITRVRQEVLETKQLVVAQLLKCGYTVLPTHPSVSICTIYGFRRNVVAEMASIAVRVEAGSAFVQTHAEFDDSFCRIRMPGRSLVGMLIERLSSVEEIPCI